MTNRPSPPVVGVSSERRSGQAIARGTLLALVFIGLALNIYLVSPAVAGLPLRFAYMLLLLLALAMMSPRETMQAVIRCRVVLAVIAYLAVVGFALAVPRDGAADAATVLIANHAQGMVLLITTVVATMVLGQRSVTMAFASAVAISIFFSMLQWLNVGPALAVRDYLGTFHFDKVTDADIMADRYAGLSYSAIILGNQMALAFAVLAFGAFNQFGRRELLAPQWAATAKRWIVIAVIAAILFVASLVQGNRSPILGLLLFLAVLPGARNPRLLIITIPLMVGLYFLLDPVREVLAGSGFRAAETGDKSAMARSPLLIYGWRLFLAHPLGYGVTFDSRLLSTTVQTGDLLPILSSNHLEGIFVDRDLHNYWLLMLDTYGVFLVPVAITCFWAFARYWSLALPFVPYLGHITFHNAAPLANDYMFWVALGIIMGSSASARTLVRRGRKRGPLGGESGRPLPDLSPLPEYRRPLIRAAGQAR